MPKKSETLPEAGPNEPRPKKKPGPQRPPNRMRAVEQLVARYLPAREIAARIAERFGCSERTVYDDIRLVWKELAKEDEEERAVRKNQMRSTLRRLFNKAVRAEDYKAAIQALDRLCKLDGLLAPVKVEHAGELGVAAMRSGDRRARLEDLLDVALERSGVTAPST